MRFNVCLLPLLIFMMVLMTWMLAQMKVYFPLLYAEWPIWTCENAIECKEKCKNRYWMWVTCKCSLLGGHECIFALLVVNSRKWMRIFSYWTAKGVLHLFLFITRKYTFIHAKSYINNVKTFYINSTIHLRAILRESEAKLEMKNYNPPSFFVRR